MKRPSPAALKAALALDRVSSRVDDTPLAEVYVRGEVVDMRRVYNERRKCSRCGRSSA